MNAFQLGDVIDLASGGAVVENGVCARWYPDRRKAIKAAGGPDLDKPRAVEVLAVSPRFETKEVAA